MKRAVRLVVNGEAVEAMVEPRTHLADFLRETLTLTGLHLRCEQGACGACTILIDGHPARACLTFPVLCEGAEITTLEGLEDDPATVALRHAFMAEHGVQCGFCTPGMLVTARDIVLRLRDADEARIREELSGNLCRCTGYAGIVRAIRRVVEERAAGRSGAARPLPGTAPVGARPAVAAPEGGNGALPGAPAPGDRTSEPTGTVAPAGSIALDGAPTISVRRRIVVAKPPAPVWAALSDPTRVAPCMPGARLTAPPSEGRLTGEIAVRLGPIAVTFAGEGSLETDDEAMRGRLLGHGAERSGRSKASGAVAFSVTPLEGGASSAIDVSLEAILRGPLAQFARGAIVADLAGRLLDAFGENLSRSLDGAEPAAALAPIGAGALLWAAIRSRIAAFFARRGR